jgi:hypothetical protein
LSEEIDKLIDAFGNGVIKRDHEALDILLAPWIGVGAALDQFQENVAEMSAEWELPDNAWPTDFEGAMEALSYESLREPTDFSPGKDIPARVDADNYVGWGHITFYPPEGEADFDAYCDAWFAIVQIAGTHMIGSLELTDPD